MFKNENSRIYTTHGGKKALIGVRLIIDEHLCLAYIKGNQVISYEPYESLCKQMVADGPIGIFDHETNTIIWPPDIM